MARPVKKIDSEQVRKLAEMGCTVEEIAAVVDCSHDTLQRRFASKIAKGHQVRNNRLRRVQLKLALAGNVAMAIWLGKVYLDQHETTEIIQTSDPLAELLAEFKEEHARLAKNGR